MDHSLKPDSFSTPESWHRHTLNSLSVNGDQEMLIYSYCHVMHGFTARLTPSQLARLETSPAHRATFEDSFGQLLTTHTPKFLGLNRGTGIWPKSAYGNDVIIGVIDTGVWPENKSFSDKGMGPVPERWKGKCENGTGFSPSLCNRKLIGARSFSRGLLAGGQKISQEDDYDSARDFMGHGTHTASTAGGNRVLDTSHFGYASGTARGVAPGAHIAMYKVVWATSTNESAASDVLAGMDQAIADGVDILSLSLGFVRTPYFKDVIAIASLSAIEKGIFVACAGGNSGPSMNTTVNGAPWITTVGAGTIDRNFVAKLLLGNGLAVEGKSYFPQRVSITNASLHYRESNVAERICNSSALNPKEVAGKVVLCDNSTKTPIRLQIQEVHKAGAIAGIFLTDNAFTSFPNDYTIPSLTLPTSYGPTVGEYAKRRTKATVKSMRFLLTTLGKNRAPQVAYFSSRGPDPITPGILKPDILAPGFDILAAWVPNRPYMKSGIYDLVADYALLSGTSMAAPHLAGVAAMIKAVHRAWSPAAIRSALMTTANTMDNTDSAIQDQWTGFTATPLDFGAGHVNPNKAMDPGLIYDIGLQDYIEYICTLGYSKKQMSALIRKNEWSCGQNQTDLNYPSFIATFSKRRRSLNGKTFSRVVTNVGDEMSTYRAVLVVPNGMRIRIDPSTLTFTRRYQKQSFNVLVKIDEDAPSVNYGFLKWTDQHNHVVSSPIVAISS
ncbi:hypothetical protein LguiA_003933 [Lonicera macranthoides]